MAITSTFQFHKIPAVFFVASTGKCGTPSQLPKKETVGGAFVGALSEDFHMRAGDGTHLWDVAKPFLPAKSSFSQ